MAAATDAADAIRRASQQYKAFVQAAEILEQIGSLENATAEGQKALSAVRGEVETVKVELSRLKVEAMAVQTEQAEIIANANANAAGILDEAGTKVDEIISNAKREGVRINQIATDSAKSTTDQVRAEVSRLSAQRDALHIEVSTLNERAATARTEADAAEQKLVNIKSTIAKLAAA